MMARNAKRVPTNPKQAGVAEQLMGARLKLRRVELGLTQEALGLELGVTFQQIQKYEKGVNRIGSTRLEKIAQILKVPVTFFFSPSGGAQIEVESLVFVDPAFNLRLLRAYNAIEDDLTRRDFVRLLERIAGPALK